MIVILTHKSPDGDAMGSSLGLYHWLTSQGEKDVHVIIPNEYPSFLAWMPGAERMINFELEPDRCKDLIASADRIICTDFHEPNRIGPAGEELLKAAESGTPVLVIDHHLRNLGIPGIPGAEYHINSDAPAASLLVYQWIKAKYPNANIGLDSGTCFYTGLMTDTGNFAFNSNSPELYEVIADLIRIGVNKDMIYDQVFNGHTIDRMRLVGYCLNENMRILPIPGSDIKVALIALSHKDLYRFNFRSGDAEGIVNMPMSAREVCYSCVMREDKDKIKISMRSQGDRPVNIFCHEIFHGGGHKNASGGEFTGSIQDAINAFTTNYLRYCK